jgi:hypothetical protein
MPHNIIYIINNKLHNKKYNLYTLIFYALIMHSYYILYINLHNNNYIAIVIYFVLLLLFYIKFKKFSYVITYIYLLFTLVFIKYNIKENSTNLRQTVAEQGAATGRNLTTNMPLEDNSITPCEKYIMDKMVERGLTIEQPANTPQPGTVKTSLNVTPSEAISKPIQFVG